MKHFALSTALALVLAVPALNPARAEEPHYGGNMIMTYKDDVATLDPAIGYDWQNWSMIKSVFSGLMDYEPGTTNLRPGLAESYEISDDGLTYTFHLRKGVKFHNGREMVADDVVYSINRVINPATQSPGQGFFAMLEGYDAAASGEADHVSGVSAPDDSTVVFHLTRPDATFLHIMAINFSFVVPKEVVEAEGDDFGKKPVGTGAYKLAEWTLGQRLVFEKNPDYYIPGIPYLDSFTVEVGQDPVVALLRVQSDEVDLPGDGVPPAKFVEVMSDPAQAALVVEGGQLQTGYVTMNVTKPPFDKVEVRRAVNMAINKDRIVQVINGRAIPANQPLPPTMPGYTKDYKGYPYDPEAAKALLAEAGYPNGFDTELYVMNTDPNPRIAQAIQQDLKEIGINAAIKSLAQANVIEAGGNGSAPMIWSGGMAWIADFPDASNFYGPILGCEGAIEGGWNWAKYCNEELDAKAAKANSIVDPAREDERLALWSEIYMQVMEDAPWAPIFNEQRFTLKSSRLGGDDSLFVDPIRIPVAYDYVYIKE